MKGGLARFAAAEAGITAAGLVVTAVVPLAAETRLSALVGVALAGGSGALSLWLKQRGMVGGDMSGALKAIGYAFGLRAVVVLFGLAWVVGQRFSTAGYVLGFFGVYFAQQVIEIAYVLGAGRGDGQDG